MIGETMRAIEKAIEQAIKKMQIAEMNNNIIAYKNAVDEYYEIQKKCTHANQTFYQSHYPSVITICEDCDKLLTEVIG